MAVLNRVFTEEEINDIMHCGVVCDENTDDPIYKKVDEKYLDSDTEKGSVTKYYIIEDCATGKLYKAKLTSSQWWEQGKYNAQEPWGEVFRKEKTIYEYEFIQV
jgi:hypothetical protein